MHKALLFRNITVKCPDEGVIAKIKFSANQEFAKSAYGPTVSMPTISDVEVVSVPAQGPATP